MARKTGTFYHGTKSRSSSNAGTPKRSNLSIKPQRKGNKGAPKMGGGGQRRDSKGRFS